MVAPSAKKRGGGTNQQKQKMISEFPVFLKCRLDNTGGGGGDQGLI